MYTEFGVYVEVDFDFDEGKEIKQFYQSAKDCIISNPLVDRERTRFIFHGTPHVIYLMTGLYVDNIIPAFNMTLLSTVGFQINTFVGVSNYTRAIAGNLNKRIETISNLAETDVITELTDCFADGLTIVPFMASDNAVVRSIRDSVEISGGYIILNPEKGIEFVEKQRLRIN